MKRLKPTFKQGFAAALFCLATASAHAADLLDTVKQAGVLKIALEGTYPPFAKAIAAALDSMGQDGTLKKISMQWFGTDTSKPVTQ